MVRGLEPLPPNRAPNHQLLEAECGIKVQVVAYNSFRNDFEWEVLPWEAGGEMPEQVNLKKRINDPGVSFLSLAPPLLGPPKVAISMGNPVTPVFGWFKWKPKRRPTILVSLF